MRRIKLCNPKHLRSIPVFDKLPLEKQLDLSKLAIGKAFMDGEFIAHQGEIWPYALILIDGEVNVQKLSTEGRSLGAWRFCPGEIFWSPSLFDGGQLPASLEVRKKCTAYLWRGEDLLPIIQDYQDAIWDLCLSFVHRMRQASNMVEDLAFHPVAARVARLLIKQSEGATENQVTRSFTLDEMATMIGTTPVMVCKIISSFASDDLLKVSRTEFEFLDKDRLEEIAGQR
jgi:CRP/FNR family transcriptional regulator